MEIREKSPYIILVMISLFFTWVFFSIFLAEHIPASNGLGWDGVMYTKFAQNIYNNILNHDLSPYSVQRIIPSSLIYVMSKVFHFSVTEKNAPFLFSILNACMLTAAVFIWFKLARKLNWNLYVQIISFSGLFLNYVNLKMSFYYPTLTDTTAFTLGLFMLYCYVDKKQAWLLATSIVGAFTFPTILYVGFIFFISPINIGNSKVLKNTTPFPVAITLLQVILVTGVCISLHMRYNYVGAIALGSNYSLPVLTLSSFALFLYIFLALRPMTVYYLSALSGFIKKPGRILCCILVYILVSIIMNLISGDSQSELTPFIYLIHIANQALAYPFNFLISHVIYYGPIVLFLLYAWKEVVEYISQKGVGLFIVTGICLILSIGSESRQLINFFPIAVFLTAEILNRKVLSWSFTLFFVSLSVLISKCWLPLNHGEWPSLYTNPPQTTLEFPLQWYFMSQGPWMSQFMYLIHLIVILGAGLLLYVFFKKRTYQCEANFAMK
ncbi:MAG: hypothetical protein H0U73_11520 [Tatlockia sp.]|nr:hypothetical protein [Tatlockia sp.]